MRIPFSLVLGSALSVCALGGCENNGGAVPMSGSSGTPTPVETASPSQTGTPTPTPAASPTPTPTPKPTLTPTSAPTPSASPTPSATPTGVICPAIALVPPQLAYPIPGATSVPTAPGYLIFYGALPSTYTGTLTPVSGTAIALGSFTAPPSPLPSPLAPRGTGPGAPTAPVAAVAFPQLASATTYAITFADTGQCAMTVGNPSYTFTTQ